MDADFGLPLPGWWIGTYKGFAGLSGKSKEISVCMDRESPAVRMNLMAMVAIILDNRSAIAFMTMRQVFFG